MISAIRDIGKYIWDKEGYLENVQDLTKVFIEDPSDKGKYNNVLLISIVHCGNGCYRYDGVRHVLYDDTHLERYLYRSGSSRGADITPTAKLTDPKKTIPNKILKCFQDFQQGHYPDVLENEKMHIIAIGDMLQGIQNKIINDIQDIVKRGNKKDRYLISLAVKDHDRWLYVGDFNAFRAKLVEDSLKGMYYSQTFRVNTIVHDKVCSICGMIHKKLYGLASPFPFYTIDKPGYIAGGFRREDSWRNYPICHHCAIYLELGRKYLESQLRFKMFGKDCYIIPKTLNEGQLGKILEYLKRMNRKDTFSEIRAAYLAMEEKMFKFLGQADSGMMIHFLFFEENQSALNILLDLQDIVPSRLKEIFYQIESINSSDFFGEFPISKEKYSPVFINFKTLNNLFSDKVSTRYYLDITGKIIRGDPIDYQFLLPFILQDIYRSFAAEDSSAGENKKGNYMFTTIGYYGLLSFFTSLHLLKTKGKEDLRYMCPMKNVYYAREYQTKEEMYTDFFNDNSNMFQNVETKAVFLLGFLVQKLLNIQWNKYEGRTPFRARLKGLRLNQRDIKRLYYETVEKLEEYREDDKKNIYRAEESLIAQFLVQSGDHWNMLPGDIPFYFALGMNMVSCFIFEKKEDE